MPIAMPPPDIDPTVVPPVSTEFTQAETWETGVAAEEPPPVPSPASTTGLLVLWGSAKPRTR